MTRLAQTIRSHREFSRNRRALAHAINNAATASMRDELIVIAQRSNSHTI